MSSAAFTTTPTDLLPTLSELITREPIFHRPEFASDSTGFERMTSEDYWEIGASGSRYSREFILRALAKNPPVDAATAGWQISGEALRRLGPDTYLLTYTLHQGERITRRATLWEATPEGWRILYHQGTIVSANEDDVFPS